jgi:hypothetical protein
MEGLVWWRSHEQQEIVTGYQNLGYATMEYNIHVQALASADCPLPGNERSRALDWIKYRHARSILRTALITLSPRKALQIMHQTAFSPRDLKRAFVPSRVWQNR